MLDHEYGMKTIFSLFAFSFTKGYGVCLKIFYYMANPVLGKSLCSYWLFLGQDFAVRTLSTVQSVYFCFGAKPANSTFATKTAKKSLKIVILHIETTSRS